jgi:hypothetical protein
MATPTEDLCEQLKDLTGALRDLTRAVDLLAIEHPNRATSAAIRSRTGAIALTLEKLQRRSLDTSQVLRTLQDARAQAGRSR